MRENFLSSIRQAKIHYAINLIFHSLAAALIIEAWDSYAPMFQGASSFFIICFSLSFIISLLMPFLNKGTFNAAFFIRINAVMLIIYPCAENTYVHLLLTIALILDVFQYGTPFTARILGGSVLAVFAFIQLPHSRWDPSLSQPHFLDAAFSLVFLSVIWFLSNRDKMEIARRYRQQQEIDALYTSVQRLTSANLNFQYQATSLEKRSIDEERKRITRELHDTMGYTFTNIIMIMESALRESGSENEELLRLLSLCRTQAQEGLQETRKVLYWLRQQETPALGMTAINRMIRIFEDITGMVVKQTYATAVGTYHEAIDHFIYKFVQECLVNAFKHAHASYVYIHYYRNENTFSIMVQDNGKGSAAVKEGIGITGIRERLKMLQGTLDIDNSSDGFRIIATLPITKNFHEEIA